jgi:hypothetical protein
MAGISAINMLNNVKRHEKEEMQTAVALPRS